MVKLLSWIISRVKKDQFNFDSNIPSGYLVNFIIVEFFRMLYGTISLRGSNLAFRSFNSKLKCRGKFYHAGNVRIESNVFINALSIYGIKCGRNVSFGRNTTMIVSGSLQSLGKGVVIGNNVGLGTHGFYGGSGGLEIGDDTIFGNYVSVHPENHNYGDLDIPIRLQGVNHKGIKIGKGCWIGAKATILDGADIGDGCIVAAGAIVRGKFPPNSIIGGIPAKIIKMRK